MAKTKKTAQNKLTLTVTSRQVFGKNLGKLRATGAIPANIYGPKFASKSVSVPFKDFINTYKQAHETGVIYLNLEKDEIPVLIKNVQRHPVSNAILHTDFRKIDLKQKIETDVPVKIIGESVAVNQKGGVLLHLSHTLLVEALPTDIPSEISVDISKLLELGQEIKVSDLTKSDSFTIKELPDKVIVSVVEHKEESVTPETVSAAPEVITEKPAEGEETPAEATPAEGAAAPAQAQTGKPSAQPEKKSPPQTAKPQEAKK